MSMMNLCKEHWMSGLQPDEPGYNPGFQVHRGCKPIRRALNPSSKLEIINKLINKNDG